MFAVVAFTSFESYQQKKLQSDRSRRDEGKRYVLLFVMRNASAQKIMPKTKCVCRCFYIVEMFTVDQIKIIVYGAISEKKKTQVRRRYKNQQ